MIGSLIVLAAVSLPVLIAAAVVASGDPAPVAETLVRFGVALFGAIVFAMTLLGFAGLLIPTAMALVSLALLASAVLVFGIHPKETPLPAEEAKPRPRWGTLVLLSVLLTLIAVAAVLALRFPVTSYDAMTYHAFFPVKWLQAGRIEIVPTPFGDPAPAYSPSNVELIYLWTLIPLKSDLLMRAGQIPFLLLALAALYGIGRHMGFSKGTSLLTALPFAANPLVLSQAASPEVDLALAAFFVSGIYLTLRYIASGNAGAAALAGMAFGLMLGTKYLGALYALPATLFLVVAVIVRCKDSFARAACHLLAALWGIPVLGGIWYIRNWALLGSPIYPGTVELGGRALFAGAYTRAAMLKSPFHIPDASWIPPIVAQAFDPRLFPLYLVCLLFGIGAAIALRKGPLRLAVLLAPPVLIALVLWLVPYNSQYRFLLPAVTLAWPALGAALELPGRTRWIPAILLALSLAWVCAAPFPEAEWLRIRFSAEGLIRVEEPAALAICFCGVLGILALLFALFRKRTLLPLVLTLAGTVLIGYSAWPLLCDASSCRPLRIGKTASGDLPWQAWSWIHRNLRGVTLAYAGNNCPYHLLGEQPDNRVMYINVNAHPSWKFHDYENAKRWSESVDLSLTDKPAAYREQASFEAWMKNLESAGVGYLFVTPMNRSEKEYLHHDRDGFPMERAWARSDPDAFTLLYSDNQAEVYRVRFSGEKDRIPREEESLSGTGPSSD